jgi:hypothetical protein
MINALHQVSTGVTLILLKRVAVALSQQSFAFMTEPVAKPSSIMRFITVGTSELMYSFRDFCGHLLGHQG